MGHKSIKRFQTGGKLRLLIVAQMYRQADSKDVGVVREYFAEDAKVHFGNAPPITGTTAIKGLFAWEYSAVESLDHV